MALSVLHTAGISFVKSNVCGNRFYKMIDFPSLLLISEFTTFTQFEPILIRFLFYLFQLMKLASYQPSLLWFCFFKSSTYRFFKFCRLDLFGQDLILWGWHFFHVNPGYWVPARVRVSTFDTLAIADPESHAHVSRGDFLTYTFDLSHSV